VTGGLNQSRLGHFALSQSGLPDFLNPAAMTTHW
jgi:hypothetical protein